MLASQEVWAALVGKSHKNKLELFFFLPGEEAHSVQMSDYKGSQTPTLGGKVRTRESERVSGWQAEQSQEVRQGGGRASKSDSTWELSTKIQEQEVTQMFHGLRSSQIKHT